MDSPYLIYFAIVLLMGTLISALAIKISVSNIYLLMGAGMILGALDLLEFSRELVILLGTISLILVVFEGTMKFKVKQIEKFSGFSMRLVLLFFFLCLAILSFATVRIFTIQANSYISYLLAFIFSCLMFSIDHSITLDILKIKNKILNILEVESLLNRPLTLIAPLILINYVQSIESSVPEMYIFFYQILGGLFIGTLIGIIMVIVLNAVSDEMLSGVAVLTFCIVTYSLAEIVNSSGVLALTCLALVFGNSKIKHKAELKKLTSFFMYVLNVIIFIVIGSVLFIELRYFFRGTLLFIIFILIRGLAVGIAFVKSRFSWKQKLFMTLHVPKGIEVAIIILIMMGLNIEGIELIISLSLMFLLYSIILSNIITLFANKLLK